MRQYIEQAQIAILEDPRIKALKAMMVDIIKREPPPTMIIGRACSFDLIRLQNPLIKQLDSEIDDIQRKILNHYKRMAREAGI